MSGNGVIASASDVFQTFRRGLSDQNRAPILASCCAFLPLAKFDWKSTEAEQRQAR